MNQVKTFTVASIIFFFFLWIFVYIVVSEIIIFKYRANQSDTEEKIILTVSRKVSLYSNIPQLFPSNIIFLGIRNLQHNNIPWKVRTIERFEN